MKTELLKGLTDEQIAKVRACKAQEEMLTLAKKEGIELTDEQLEAVSGGACTNYKCPNCGRGNAVETWHISKGTFFSCPDCHYYWDKDGRQVTFD